MESIFIGSYNQASFRKRDESNPEGHLCRQLHHWRGKRRRSMSVVHHMEREIQGNLDGPREWKSSSNEFYKVFKEDEIKGLQVKVLELN